VSSFDSTLMIIGIAKIFKNYLSDNDAPINKNVYLD